MQSRVKSEKTGAGQVARLRPVAWGDPRHLSVLKVLTRGARGWDPQSWRLHCRGGRSGPPGGPSGRTLLPRRPLWPPQVAPLWARVCGSPRSQPRAPLGARGFASAELVPAGERSRSLSKNNGWFPGSLLSFFISFFSLTCCNAGEEMLNDGLLALLGKLEAGN